MSEPPAMAQRDCLPLSLRLDAFIEQWRADRRPQWPAYLPISNLRHYQTTTVFCAARPSADRPHPRFVAAMQAYLLGEVLRRDS
jgi:hypothetical protein